MLPPTARRLSAFVLCAATVALATGCGNRLEHDYLRAEVGGEAVSGTAADPSSAGAMQPEAPLATAQGQRQVLPTDAGLVPAPAASTAGQAPTAATKPGTGTGKPTAQAPSTRVEASTSTACVKPLSPIKIGSVGENSGVPGAIFGGGPKVLQAWVQWMNAKGGIKCHPLEAFVGDDGGDPSSNQALVQRFVEQNGVVAFVFMNAPFAGEASVKYLKAKGIPVFGSEGGSEWFNQNPNYFPQMATGRQIVETSFAMAGHTLVPKGLTKIASFTCVEAPICSSAYGYAGDLAQKYGMELVSRAQISMTQPNFTSVCLQAKNAGAQILFSGVDGNSDQRIARSCESVGFKPKIVTMAVGLTLAQAAAPILAGIQVSLPVALWFSTEISAVAEFADAIAKYAVDRRPDAVGMQAWSAAQMFAFAVSKAGPDITSASVMQGAYQIKNNTLGGLTQPLTFKEGAPNNMQRMCWWAAEFNGEKVTSPNGGRMTCE